MDTRLLKILEEETTKEKAKKKKKLIFKVRKEKLVMYYSGWGKGKPIKEEKPHREKSKRQDLRGIFDRHLRYSRKV